MYTLLSPLLLSLLFTLSPLCGAVKSVKMCLLNELFFWTSYLLLKLQSKQTQEQAQSNLAEFPFDRTWGLLATACCPAFITSRQK